MGIKGRSTLCDYYGSTLHDLEESGKAQHMSTWDIGLEAAMSGMHASELEGAPVGSREKRAARLGLLAFMKEVHPKFELAWHQALLAEYLDQLYLGNITRLMVLMPPRHGKSEMVSRYFPAHILGRNPNEQIMATSYAGNLAQEFNIDVQNIMSTEKYKYIFERTRLNEHSVRDELGGRTVRTSHKFQIVGHKGYLVSTGFSGSLTGKGYTMGIVDDPIKNMEEAQSETYRNKLWHNWNSAFLTRGEGQLAKSGAHRIVVCLTPWHEDDLHGRILKQAKETGEHWEILRLPAMRESEDHSIYPPHPSDQRKEGEALWPAKESLAALELKKSQDSYTWTALYQCRPSIEGGAIFKRRWFRWYKESDLPKADSLAVSIDASFKATGKSYVVVQTWAILGEDRYLVDMTRERLSFIDTVDTIIRAIKDQPYVDEILVEEAANGAAIIDTLKREFGGVVAIKAQGSKVARAHAVTKGIKDGHVYLPLGKEWIDVFMSEVTGFDKAPNDDIVDAMTQFLRHYDEANPVELLRALASF